MRQATGLGVAFAAALVIWTPTVYGGGIPTKTLKDLKAASVFIKVQSAPPGGKVKAVPLTGSGFVIHREEGAGFIATNFHVLTPLPNEILLGKPKVVFQSGTPKEKTVEGQMVAGDPIRDLAILKVPIFEGFPNPIAIDAAIEVDETMPVYAFGFPFGEQLALDKGNPAITITKGTVSALRYDKNGQIHLVQIDAEVNPGNSGGPVVDDKGKLLGVAVSKVMKARTIGFAIPAKAAAEMLHGKVASVFFDTIKVEKGVADIQIEAPLIDPLNKLKDLTLSYRLAPDPKDLLEPAKEGKIPLLKDANDVRLNLEQGMGKAKLALKVPGGDKATLAFQAHFVNAVGEKVIAPIATATVDFTQTVYSDRLPWSLLGASQKIFTYPMKAGKHYVIVMRADPRDLDPRLIVRDPAGKVLAEDDGAGGTLNALLVLAPPKDADYQIVATATRGSGPFTLRLREDSGRELERGGWSTSARLQASDPLDPLMRSPARSFNLILKKGKHYTIDMKSDGFDPYLRVENMANENIKSEDIGGNGRSTLFLSPFRDGIYRLIATSYDFKDGPFDLQVRETPGPKRFDADPKGVKLTETLTAFDPLDIVNGQPTQFRCKAFEVKMKAGQKYQIDLKSTQFDPYLRVEDMKGKQLAADDDSGGMLNARLVFTPPADGVYRIIATQFDARLGSFELIIEPLP